MDITAGVGFQFDVLGAPTALGEVFGDAVGGFLVGRVGRSRRPQGIAAFTLTISVIGQDSGAVSFSP